jgi:deoxyribonuclease V
LIACFDVDYNATTAHVGAVVFRDWEDAQPFKVYDIMVNKVSEYIPGQFYKRELPCINALLDNITEPIEIIIVDGYAWLEENKKGLGAYLYEDLNKNIPVIGVAKNKYKKADYAIEVFRGESQNPLYVSAAGIKNKIAANCIKRMAGDFRNPTLLKLVDAVARNW